MTRLVGERLVLRELAWTDEQAVHAYASDPLVTRYTDWGPNGAADTRAFLAEVTANASDREFNFGAVEAETGRLVGAVSIVVTSARHRRGELGYVFHPDVWSRGYATEASRLLIRFGAESLRLRRITATCHPDNRASARVLEKAGLHYEGRLRSHMFARGEWRDSLLYAIVV